MSRRSHTRSDQIRRAIAQEAARIMSEQGIEDFLLAKRKAAERFGVSDASVLPKNTEIEAALEEHHRLFDAHKHTDTLIELRRLALRTMHLLSEFEPRLVGPVLSGTASAHSEINLHPVRTGSRCRLPCLSIRCRATTRRRGCIPHQWHPAIAIESGRRKAYAPRRRRRNRSDVI
jgi:hypothetical protein